MLTSQDIPIEYLMETAFFNKMQKFYTFIKDLATKFYQI